MRVRSALPLLTIFLATGASCPEDDGGYGLGVDVELPAAGEPFLEVSGELFVTGGGTVYRAVEEPMGMVPLPAGGPTWEVAELTTVGLSRLVELLDENAFLGMPPDYSRVIVSDVSPSRVIVRTADATYEHEAFIDHVDEGTGGEAYERFRDVVEGVRDLERLVDGEIGEFAPYVPTSWDVVDNIGPGGIDHFDDEVEPWPFAAPPVEGCTTFPDDDVTADGIDDATGRYVSGRQVLDVEARLPWDGPC